MSYLVTGTAGVVTMLVGLLMLYLNIPDTERVENSKVQIVLFYLPVYILVLGAGLCLGGWGFWLLHGDW